MTVLEDYRKQKRKDAQVYIDAYAAEMRTQEDAAYAQIDRRYREGLGSAAAAYQTAKTDTAASYRSLYDANALRESVRTRNLSESAHNLGLNRSGTAAQWQNAVRRERRDNDTLVTDRKQQALRALDDRYRSIVNDYDAWRDSEQATVADTVAQAIRDATQSYTEQADEAARRLYEDDLKQAAAQAEERRLRLYEQVLQQANQKVAVPTVTLTAPASAQANPTESLLLRVAEELAKNTKDGMTQAWYAVTKAYRDGTLTRTQMNDMLREFGILSPSQQEYYTDRAGNFRYTVPVSPEQLRQIAISQRASEISASSVDTAFIERFFEDHNAAVEALQSLSFDNAAAMAETEGQRSIDLRKRGAAVLTFLEEYRERLGEEQYQSLAQAVNAVLQQQARLHDSLRTYANSVSHFANKNTDEVTLNPYQQEYYRLRAGDGRYVTELSDDALNDKVNLERGTLYGPREVRLKYDFGTAGSDNLKPRSKALSYTLPTDTDSFKREMELSEQYHFARDGEKVLFLSVDGGIDFSKITDYEPYYTWYIQQQTVGGMPFTKSQSKMHTAAFLIALYDESETQRQRDGAYEPHTYLAFRDFYRRLANGNIRGIDAEAVSYAMAELENYKNGNAMAETVMQSSLVIKLMHGYIMKFGESAEAINTLPDTLLGKMTPTPAPTIAYNVIGQTLDAGAKAAYTVSGALGAMTPYLLAGAGGGAALGNAVMFTQSLSSSMGSSLREGQEYLDSLGYGVTSATMELVLNKLIGATGGALGTSALGKTASSVIQKGTASIPTDPLIQKMLTIGGQRLIAGVGEYAEESLQTYTGALLRNFYFDEHGQIQTLNEEAAYNGWIGFVVGMLLGDGQLNADTSSQLLDGTATENAAIVKSLCDATEILSLNAEQQQLVNDTLSNADKLSTGDGGNALLLEAQVQRLLNLWTDTVSSSPTVDELSAAFQAGIDGKRYTPDATAEITSPQVAELMEAFTAGLEGRKYEPKNKTAAQQLQEDIVQELDDDSDKTNHSLSVEQRIVMFRKQIQDGEIKTTISKQKQSRHMRNTREFEIYASKLATRGDYPSYLKEDLSLEEISIIVNETLGKGVIELRNDGSFQEYIDCNEVIGYYYNKKQGAYMPTKRLQVKYAVSNGNIHVIPVKETGRRQ